MSEIVSWGDIEVFVLVHETGSFQAAAKRLQIHAATVSRRITEMEERVGTQLFRRHREGVDLTDEGKSLLEESKAVAHSARAFLHSYHRLSGSRRIVVRADEMLVNQALLPLLTGEDHGYFGEIKRKIDPRVLEGVEPVIHGVQGIACAWEFRWVMPGELTPAQNDFVTRKVATTRFQAFYSLSYAQHYGEPRDFINLAEHRLATLSIYETFNSVQALAPWLEVCSSTPHLVRSMPTSLYLERMASVGTAIVLLPSWVGMSNPALIPVPHCPDMHMDLRVVYSRPAMRYDNVLSAFETLNQALKDLCDIRSLRRLERYTKGGAK